MTTVPDFPERPSGRWVTEDRYEFDTALELGPGQQAVTLDFSQIELPEGLSREDVIEAMSNPLREWARPVPQHFKEIPISCPGCGRHGKGLLDLTKGMLQMGLDPFVEADVAEAHAQIDGVIAMDGDALKDNVLCEDCKAAAS